MVVLLIGIGIAIVVAALWVAILGREHERRSKP